MTHAVFLSMGGEKDTHLAEEVMRHLPTAMVYMYTKTGADHVSFREEIEAEVGSCVVFVTVVDPENFYNKIR